MGSCDHIRYVGGDEVKFAELNITDALVILVLGAALLMAIFYRMNELSANISIGLIGYIGGSARGMAATKNNGGSGGKTI